MYNDQGHRSLLRLLRSALGLLGNHGGHLAPSPRHTLVPSHDSLGLVSAVENMSMKRRTEGNRFRFSRYLFLVFHRGDVMGVNTCSPPRQ